MKDFFKKIKRKNEGNWNNLTNTTLAVEMKWNDTLSCDSYIYEVCILMKLLLFVGGRKQLNLNVWLFGAYFLFVDVNGIRFK